MRSLRVTAVWILSEAAGIRCRLRLGSGRFKLPARQLVASVLAAVLALAPVPGAFAQEPAQNPPAQAQAPAPQSAPAVPVSLGLSKHNYSRGPRAFPNLINPYKPITVEAPSLVNSPRIEQLIHDGKLELSLQDAVELALENSVDIAVQRYNTWIADLSILKTKAGGFGFGTPGGAFASSTANINPFTFTNSSFDPLITSSIFIDDRSLPVNNPFISGTGTASLAALISHTSQFNTQYSQVFHTRTSVTASWNNT